MIYPRLARKKHLNLNQTQVPMSDKSICTKLPWITAIPMGIDSIPIH